MTIHNSIKKCLRYRSKVSAEEILKDWKKRTSEICKPCWELKYCPYGPVVEDFPLLPPMRKYAVDHNSYLKECLKTGKLGSGEKLDRARKNGFRRKWGALIPRSTLKKFQGYYWKDLAKFLVICARRSLYLNH